MQPGNVFTIEPIFMSADIKTPYIWDDDFTMIAPGIASGKKNSKKPSIFLAQWEHTILITDTGHEVLTKRVGEVVP